MKIIVTGGAGFVGANLCRDLASRDHEVVVIDDLSTGFRSNLVGLPVKLVVGTILDVEALASVLRGADSVVHLAARGSVPRSVADPITTNEINVTGTLNVLQAARDVGAHVVLASSSSVYGANTASPKHEALQTMPMSPYAVSKLATESYGLAFQNVYGLETLVFRFFNIFGPLQSARHDYAAVVPAFVSSMIDRQPLRIFGDGKQSRDFTPVETVVKVVTDAVERRITYKGAVNLALGTQTTLLELVGALETLTGEKATVEWHTTRPGDVRASCADGTLLRSLFPSVRAQSFDEGLEATFQWFQTTGGYQS